MAVPSYGCVPHLMHLVLASLLYPKRCVCKAIAAKKALISIESVNAFDAALDEDEKQQTVALAARIEALRDIVKYFGRSSKGVSKLISYPPSNAAPLKLVTDVVTRWNSTCNMLKRLLTLKGCLEEFILFAYSKEGRKEFGDFDKKKPRPDDWFIVECLLKVLSPFEAASSLLSGDKYGTMLLAFPTLRMIERTLSVCTIFDEIVVK
jgi:hypothetical protein